MSWFEIDKMLIVVLTHEFIVPFIIIVGTLSFATGFAAWASLVPVGCTVLLALLGMNDNYE